MRCIRSLSPELEELISRHYNSRLGDVIDIALEVASLDHAGDHDVMAMKNEYDSKQYPSLLIAGTAKDISRECDRQYLDLEDAGEIEASQVFFRKMCIMNGLSRLFSVARFDAPAVDNIVYDFAYSSSSIDDFVKQVLIRLDVD